MPPKRIRYKRERRSDAEFRAIVQRAIEQHKHKEARRDWRGSALGVLMILGGVVVFVVTNHAKGAEWVALALIVLGAGLFDRKAVTGLVRARFGNGSGNTSEYGVSDRP